MSVPTVAILIRGLTTAERDQLREIAWKGRTSVAVLVREMIRTKLHAVNRAAAAKPKEKVGGFLGAMLKTEAKPKRPAKGSARKGAWRDALDYSGGPRTES